MTLIEILAALETEMFKPANTADISIYDKLNDARNSLKEAITQLQSEKKAPGNPGASTK